jgi:hypothetical protein
MKDLFLTLIASVALVLQTACTAPSVDSVAGRLELAAAMATELTLENNPSERIAFERALAGLKAIEASGSATVQSIASALQAAGIDQLQSKDAKLIIAGSRIVFYDYLNATSAELDRNLMPIVKALRSGIERSL